MDVYRKYLDAAMTLRVGVAIYYRHDLFLVDPGVVGKLRSGRRVLRGWNSNNPNGAWLSFNLDEITRIDLTGSRYGARRVSLPHSRKFAELASIDCSIE
jgi:hypothetical protein